MKRFTRAFLGSLVLAAAIFLVVVPSSLADNPRGIWCNGPAPLTLPNPDAGSTISTGLVFHGTAPEPAFVTLAPFTAVNVEVDNGKALGAAGLVTRANFLPGTGAFCPGDPTLAGKTFTPVLDAAGNQTIVNNLGLVIPGDPGAIYVLVHA